MITVVKRNAKWLGNIPLVAVAKAPRAKTLTIVERCILTRRKIGCSSYPFRRPDYVISTLGNVVYWIIIRKVDDSGLRF